MSTPFLLSRSLWSSHSPQSRILQCQETSHFVYSLQPSESTRFENDYLGTGRERLGGERGGEERAVGVAHRSGVNAIEVDKFEGRYLLSGGADSSIALWDLESEEPGKGPYKPLVFESRTTTTGGISHLAFYPFDSLAFLTSSYSHTLAIHSSETLQASASFDLSSVIYNFSLSPIASHLLVACATQSPFVRLVDLKSGAMTHSLAGRGSGGGGSGAAAVLSVCWSPTREHVLVSGSVDGVIRIWDVRKAQAELGVLDMEDSVGLPHYASRQPFTSWSGSALSSGIPKAHHGPVNGLLFHPDGTHIISTAHDHTIRIWSSITGANTLTNFGPGVRNKYLAPNIPVLVPPELMPLEKEVLLYPNDRDILMYELWEGRMLRRLRRPVSIPSRGGDQGGQVLGSSRSGTGTGIGFGSTSASGQAQLNNVTNSRVTSLSWRAHSVEFYSAHSDGMIQVWKPRTTADHLLDEEQKEEHDEITGLKRKRGVLEEIYQDLTAGKITFGGT